MTLSINPPVGFEIDKEKSYPNSNEIVYKPIGKKLPKKWGDFDVITGYYLDIHCNPYRIIDGFVNESRRNVWPTKELAEASLALCQLIRYRDAWNEGWRPDWTDDEQYKYVLIVYNDIIGFDISCNIKFTLAFKTTEIRNKFYETFKELIETAKPLL